MEIHFMEQFVFDDNGLDLVKEIIKKLKQLLLLYWEIIYKSFAKMSKKNIMVKIKRTSDKYETYQNGIHCKKWYSRQLAFLLKNENGKKGRLLDHRQDVAIYQI